METVHECKRKMCGNVYRGMRWTCFHVNELSSDFVANAITLKPELVYWRSVSMNSSGTSMITTNKHRQMVVIIKVAVAGLFSCRLHSLELSPRFVPGPEHQCRLFQTFA